MSVNLHPRNFGADARGTAAIEFAITGPLFLLLLFGMIAYGIYFGAAHSVQQIAADAARASVAGLDTEERRTLALRHIELNASDYVLLNREHIAVEVDDTVESANQFLVRIVYNARSLPIWNLYIPLPLPHSDIVRHSSIRVGGV